MKSYLNQTDLSSKYIKISSFKTVFTIKNAEIIGINTDIN